MADDIDITPASAYRETVRWAPVVTFMGVIVVLVASVIILVGWQVGGWFQQHQIQRQFNNTVNSQQYQTSLLNEMQQHLTNVGDVANTRLGVPANSAEQATLRASQLNELSSFCSESVNFIPADVPGGAGVESTVQANCTSAGTLVTDPPLANPVPQG